MYDQLPFLRMFQLHSTLNTCFTDVPNATVARQISVLLLILRNVQKTYRNVMPQELTLCMTMTNKNNEVFRLYTAICQSESVNCPTINWFEKTGHPETVQSYLISTVIIHKIGS